MKNLKLNRALMAGLIFLIFLALYNVLSKKDDGGPLLPPTEIIYSQFLTAVDENEIASVVFKGSQIAGRLKSGERFRSQGPHNVEMLAGLKEKKIDVEIAESGSSVFFWIFNIIFFTILFLSVFLRRVGIGGGGIFGLGKSQHHTLTSSQKKVFFKDVAGVDEAKEELGEIILFLKNPKRFTGLGAKIPKGVLLMGPPGTGKTLLARAVAGEANVSFLSISGSGFVEMFVGVGAARVRDLFQRAKKISPCIIFVDEIDSIGRNRAVNVISGHDEQGQTLNQLFVEMDGFEPNSGVIVIAATNRPDILDSALLRPGRFDRHIEVGLPDLNSREAILKIHTNDKALALDVDLRVISRGTPGFSGADLANLVNEAAILAGRFGKNLIEVADFQKAKDRVLMGIEKKSLVLNEQEREIVAYHEAGHTIVAKMMPGSDPIHKVTIIPRGRALGATQQLPIEDRYLTQKSAAETRLAVLMGGLAAELVRFKESSSGAQNDIQIASSLARTMVCEWGMSKELGPIAMTAVENFPSRQVGFSDWTTQKIDEEMRNVMDQALNMAKKIIEENLEKFLNLVQRLLKEETLNEKEINEIFLQKVTDPAGR